MEQVPVMLSTKDLAYLADMFEWNFTALKKCLHFSNEVQNEEIKNLISNVASMHEIHCSKILNILGGQNEQQ